MTNLKPIKCGWKWLEAQINNLIEAINARTITVPTGGGLDIRESSNGTMIALSSTNTLGAAAVAAGSGGTGGSGGGNQTGQVNSAPNGSPGWTLINVVLETDTGYQVRQMWIWGNPINL